MTFHSQTYPPVSSFAARVGMHSGSGAAGLAEKPLDRAEFYQPVDIHRALNDVRQMTEFQPSKPNWLEEFWKLPEVNQLRHQLGELLHQALNFLFGWLTQLKPPGLSHLPENIRTIFSVFVAFVLILGALFGLYLFLGWLLKRRDRLSPSLNSSIPVLEPLQPLSSRHHVQEAKRAAGEARYELALQHLYMASLCLLDEHKIAPYEANRTNLEYLALLEKRLTSTGVPLELADQAKLPANFRLISNQFEAVRYGLRPLPASQYAQSFSSYEILQTILGQTVLTQTGVSHV